MEFLRIFSKGKRDKLRKEAREVASAAKEETAREDAMRESGGSWSKFRSSMAEYFEDSVEQLSTLHPEILPYVQEKVAATRAEGKKVLMLDLFGEADGEDLGADQTLGFALTNNRGDTERRRTITGNALQRVDQDAFLNAIDATGARPIFGVLNAVGGLHYLIEDDKNVNTYAIERLARLTSESYQRFDTGGVLLVFTSWMNAPSRKLFLKELNAAGVQYTYSEVDQLVIAKKP